MTSVLGNDLSRIVKIWGTLFCEFFTPLLSRLYQNIAQSKSRSEYSFTLCTKPAYEKI
ncbi:hypothetical protein L8106_11492, partial [Lyngbya sp. PCC 8106]